MNAFPDDFWTQLDADIDRFLNRAIAEGKSLIVVGGDFDGDLDLDLAMEFVDCMCASHESGLVHPDQRFWQVLARSRLLERVGRRMETISGWTPKTEAAE